MSSSQIPDIGSGGLPGSGGSSGGQPSDDESDAEEGNTGEGEGDQQSGQSRGSSGVPTWDDRGKGDGSDEGWEKGSQLPEVPVDITGGAGNTDQTGGSNPDGVPGKKGSGAAGDLEEALEDFDGGIMAERSAIRDKAASTPNAGGGNARGATGIARGGSKSGNSGVGGGDGDGNNAPDMGALPDGPSAISRAPGAPNRTAGIPKDVDDARDDDVIARQLREAAMAETDPAIREKLWADYQKYKKR